MERSLRLHLLSSAFCVQPVRRFGTLRSASRQHAQRGRLEASARPGRGALRGKVSRIYFRADAGFANPDVYEFLEAERISTAIRLPVNRIMQDRIGYLLKRPVGRPSERAAHANSGSRKARARSSGPGYRAARSPPTPFGSSFMRWPTISAISYARSRRPSR